MVQILLAEKDERTPLNSLNHWLQTPVAVAHAKGSTGVAKCLAEAGGKLACSMHESFYPLHLAALKGDIGEQQLKCLAAVVLFHSRPISLN